MGIEPTNAGATIRSVNHFAKFAIILAGVEGFEPSSTVLETAALPLNYTPIYFTACILYQKNIKKATSFLFFIYSILRLNA